MKKNDEQTTPVVTQKIWRDVLTDEDLKFYDIAADRTLVPEARSWMARGTLGYSEPKQL